MTTPTRRIPAAALDGLLLDSDPYLSCDDCFDRIDAYAEAMVADPAHRDVAMEVHLHACGACAEEAATLTDLLLGRDR